MDRPVRICDVCGGVDDHPRHTIAYPVGQAPAPDPEVFKKIVANLGDRIGTDVGAACIQDFYDTTVQLRHMDCCREVGCYDGTCNVVTTGAEDLRGPDLQAHLESRTGETYFVDGRPESEVAAEIAAAAPVESQEA